MNGIVEGFGVFLVMLYCKIVLVRQRCLCLFFIEFYGIMPLTSHKIVLSRSLFCIVTSYLSCFHFANAFLANLYSSILFFCRIHCFFFLYFFFLLICYAFSHLKQFLFCSSIDLGKQEKKYSKMCV